MQVNKLTSLVVSVLEDRQAEDIKVLDVAPITDMMDVMVIATGQSTRQVKALATQVATQAKVAGYQPLGLEGEDVGEWVLVDLGALVVQIMTAETRATYHLEKLWSVTDMSGQDVIVE